MTTTFAPVAEDLGDLDTATQGGIIVVLTEGFVLFWDGSFCVTVNQYPLEDTRVCFNGLP